jgi:eukaryotic-like serine/threonine-protein kinase
MGSEPRAEHAAQYRYRFGTAEFDEARFELRVDERAVDVQHRPLQVLAELLRNAGEVVTRDELREAVWQDRPTVENVIDTALTKIRRALGEANAARIQTEPRTGFRLVGPVERMVVGRQFSSRLSLEPGLPVPRRENFILAARLGASLHHEVWLARHAKTDEPRVYKFSADGEGLGALKREATLSRVLRSALGERQDIVRILDWNFDSPPFYLECEYGGENLLEWGRQFLQGATHDQRLALCIQIADAVAAAHGVGVLHQDLKPSNILISGGASGPQVRIADFGSARLLEPDRLTDLGITQLGLTVTQGVATDLSAATPIYIAPERLAGGTATVKSDVYALGIILYQLFIGDLRKPLVPGWERDVSDELVREDIAAATDGDPAMRLGTAAELAERLRCLASRRNERQRQRAVQHQAQMDREALRRARARRPWLVGTIAALCLGLCISLVFYRQTSVERSLAEREAAQTAAINRFLNDDLLRPGNPTAPGSISNPLLRDVLASAALKLRDDLVEAPLIKASIYTMLGQTYTGLGDYANAESLLHRAIDASSRTAAGGTVRAQAEYGLVRVLLYLSKLSEAKALLAQADTDAGAALTFPTSLAVTSHLIHGYFEDDNSRETRALTEFESADRIRRLADPGNVPLLFNTHQELIDSYIAAGRFEDAKRAAQPLLAANFTIDRVGIDNWAQVREAYAEILSQAHDYPEAIAMDQAVVSALRARLGERHFYVGIALSELGNVYVDAGSPAQALAPMRESYQIVSAAVGPQSQDAMLARANVGVVESELGQSKAGIADITAAREYLVRLFGSHNPEVEQADFYLALSLSQQAQETEAWSLVSNLSAVSLSQGGEGAEDWAQRLAALKGQILLREGHEARALALLEPAVAKMEADHVASWMVEPFRKALDEAQSHGRIE